jgi:hypothetical protein
MDNRCVMHTAFRENAIDLLYQYGTNFLDAWLTEILLVVELDCLYVKTASIAIFESNRDRLISFFNVEIIIIIN